MNDAPSLGLSVRRTLTQDARDAFRNFRRHGSRHFGPAGTFSAVRRVLRSTPGAPTGGKNSAADHGRFAVPPPAANGSDACHRASASGMDPAVKRLDPHSPAAAALAAGRYRIRVLDAAGVANVMIPWMRAAGWNPGLQDATTFLAADPGGFFVGELDDQPIATVSAVRYDRDFGFMGCYLVAAPFRGLGYGLAIHEAGRRHLAGCVQGGDGVLEKVDNYRTIGRVLAYQNTRFEGIRTDSDWRPTLPLTEVCQVPLPALETLDRACFPAARSSFLQAWLHQPDAVALAAEDTLPTGEIRGYGVIRRCFSGWKIGPLFARDGQVAEAILRGLVERIPVGDHFYLDVPAPNQPALELAARYGLREVFATARMYAGPPPAIRLDWVFGVTTFELG